MKKKHAYFPHFQEQFITQKKFKPMKKLGIILAITLTINAIFTLTLFNQFEQKMAFQTPTEQLPVQLVSNKENINVKPNSTSYVPFDFIATSKKVTQAVVNITAISRNGYPLSGGSGVIISRDGFIVTNNHVVDGSNGSLKVTLNNNKDYKAVIIGVDPTTDLALLKIEERDLPTLSYGNSDNIEVGEWVMAVGNPFNLASTVTAGIVSAKGRNIDILPGQYSIESFIQTDAVVNPGNSGGALVNNRGDLVGINAAIISQSGSYEGYSFAIPANLVKKVVNDLREYGEVRRAILGVSIGEVTDDVAKRLDLPMVEGVWISGTTEGGSAEAADIRRDDVIVAVDGVKTASMPALQEQVARYRPGQSIDVDLIRDGRKIRKSDVTLKALNSDSSAYRR